MKKYEKIKKWCITNLQISKIFAYECVKNETGILRILILITYLASI